MPLELTHKEVDQISTIGVFKRKNWDKLKVLWRLQFIANPEVENGAWFQVSGLSTNPFQADAEKRVKISMKTNMTDYILNMSTYFLKDMWALFDLIGVLHNLRDAWAAEGRPRILETFDLKLENVRPVLDKSGNKILITDVNIDEIYQALKSELSAENVIMNWLKRVSKEYMMYCVIYSHILVNLLRVSRPEGPMPFKNSIMEMLGAMLLANPARKYPLPEKSWTADEAFKKLSETYPETEKLVDRVVVRYNERKTPTKSKLVAQNPGGQNREAPIIKILRDFKKMQIRDTIVMFYALEDILDHLEKGGTTYDYHNVISYHEAMLKHYQEDAEQPRKRGDLDAQAQQDSLRNRIVERYGDVDVITMKMNNATFVDSAEVLPQGEDGSFKPGDFLRKMREDGNQPVITTATLVFLFNDVMTMARRFDKSRDLWDNYLVNVRKATEQGNIDVATRIPFPPRSLWIVKEKPKLGEPEQVLDVHVENRKYGSEVLSPNNMNVLLTVQKTMFKADGLMSNVVGFMVKRIQDGQKIVVGNQDNRESQKVAINQVVSDWENLFKNKEPTPVAQT